MMLPDPGLVETQPIHSFQRLQVPLDCQRGIVVDRMERRDEGTEAQPLGKYGRSSGIGLVSARGQFGFGGSDGPYGRLVASLCSASQDTQPPWYAHSRSRNRLGPLP